MIRAPLRFLLIFGALILLFSLALRSGPARRLVVEPVTRGVAGASGWALRLIGVPNAVSGTRIDARTGFSAEIIEACSGLDVLALVAAATLAFPAPWRARLLGLLAAVPIVQGLNLARVVTLYWLGARGSALFDAFHLYVWQAAVILVSLGLWILWAERSVLAPERRD